MYIKLAVRGQILFDANVKCDVNNETAIRQTKKVLQPTKKREKSYFYSVLSTDWPLIIPGHKKPDIVEKLEAAFRKKKLKKQQIERVSSHTSAQLAFLIFRFSLSMHENRLTWRLIALEVMSLDSLCSAQQEGAWEHQAYRHASSENGHE